MRKKLVALALAASMAVSMLAGCAGSEFDGSQVVAEVGEEKITAAVANFYARYQQAQYETYYAAYLGENMWETEAEVGVTYEENVKDSIMESLHTLYLLEMHAADYGVELSEKETEAIAEAAKAFFESNDVTAAEAVSGDEATVTEVLTLVTIQNKMYDKMVADVDRKVADSEAAQKAMDYIFFSYSVADEEGVAQDMTEEEKAETKTKAEALVKKAKAGEDFATLAEAEGLEVTSTTFDLTTTYPVEELIIAADVLAKGEVTDIIEDENGIYIAKLTSEFDKEATASKKEEIIWEREEEAYTALCDQWMEEHPITVNDSVWETIDFTKLGVTIKDTTTEE